MKKKKILIIDDFKPLLEEIVEFLEMEGYKTYSAENGLEGIQIAISKIPDIIICDIQMPKMNGYDVYKTLEKLPETKVIPFIFLTALAQVEDFRKGLELGADDYLVKPFEIEDLLFAINKRIEKSEMYKNVNTSKFEALLINPTVGTYIVNEKGVDFFNSKITEITGYTKRDITNLNFIDIIIGDTSKILSDIKMCFSGTKQTFRREVSIVNSNKKAVFVEIFGKHIKINGENAIIGTVIDTGSKHENQPLSNELERIIKFLKDSGKENIADDIKNIRNILDFNSNQNTKQKKTNLTNRELEVLKYICSGLTNTEIAEKLFLSRRTVDNHRAKVLLKTETKNTASLVAYAIKNNLIEI